MLYLVYENKNGFCVSQAEAKDLGLGTASKIQVRSLFPGFIKNEEHSAQATTHTHTHEHTYEPGGLLTLCRNPCHWGPAAGGQHRGECCRDVRKAIGKSGEPQSPRATCTHHLSFYLHTCAQKAKEAFGQRPRSCRFGELTLNVTCEWGVSGFTGWPACIKIS